MDGLVIIIIAMIFCFCTPKTVQEKAVEKEIIEDFNYEVLDRPTAVNTSFYKDEKAFRRMVDELGFN